MNYQGFYPNYMQNYQTPQTMQTVQQPQSQVQQSAFISVKNIDEAYNWPVGPGNSLTFKDENAPYIYVKTMGFSQFEAPTFEKYKITKEEDPKVDNVRTEFSNSISNLETQLEEVKDAYRLLKHEIDEMKNWMRQPFLNSNTTDS